MLSVACCVTSFKVYSLILNIPEITLQYLVVGGYSQCQYGHWQKVTTLSKENKKLVKSMSGHLEQSALIYKISKRMNKLFSLSDNWRSQMTILHNYFCITLIMNINTANDISYFSVHYQVCFIWSVWNSFSYCK